MHTIVTYIIYGIIYNGPRSCGNFLNNAGSNGAGDSGHTYSISIYGRSRQGGGTTIDSVLLEL